METPSAPARPALLGAGVGCPRCNFDLRGVVGRWRERCPLDGCCPECGLDVHWGELFRPRCYEPAWAVEFARRPSRALLPTALRTLRPAHFWGWIRLAYPVRSGRLLVFLIVLGLVAWGAVALPTGLVCASFTHGAGGTPIDVARAFARGTVTPVSSRYLVVPGPPSFTRPTPQYFFESWSGPFKGWFAFALALSFLTPGCLLALRQSMARARVRAVHVIRIAVYGYTWLLLLLVIWITPVLWFVVRSTFFGGGWFLRGSGSSLAAPGFVGWLVAFGWWWRCALRHYLKLTDVRLVMVVLGSLIVLLSLVCVYFLYPEFVNDLVPDFITDVIPVG